MRHAELDAETHFHVPLNLVAQKDTSGQSMLMRTQANRGRQAECIVRSTPSTLEADRSVTVTVSDQS